MKGLASELKNLFKTKYRSLYAQHHAKMDDMRSDVLDMAIKMKDKMGEGFDPKDMIDKEALQKVITESDGTDF